MSPRTPSLPLRPGRVALPALALVVAAGSFLVAGHAPAQKAGGPPHRPKPPLEVALDANGDGVIDADEIANASAALKKLDKNGDGRLTPDEYRPPRPAREDAPPPSAEGERKSK
ncbi:MAG TPA: EF-hand domain-containing protein [Thermoanaerobaculia bacterium]|nr:EF-hand domain-containing protein [Thermoanaerobaculia bacterium]